MSPRRGPSHTVAPLTFVLDVTGQYLDITVGHTRTTRLCADIRPPCFGGPPMLLVGTRHLWSVLYLRGRKLLHDRRSGKVERRSWRSSAIIEISQGGCNGSHTHKSRTSAISSTTRPTWSGIRVSSSMEVGELGVILTMAVEQKNARSGRLVVGRLLAP